MIWAFQQDHTHHFSTTNTRKPTRHTTNSLRSGGVHDHNNDAKIVTVSMALRLELLSWKDVQLDPLISKHIRICNCVSIFHPGNES